MWKTLITSEQVSVGDKIRFVGIFPGKPHEPFTVVKTEDYYFQILPTENTEDEPRRKVIKYHDLGYYLKAEIWKQL